MKPLNTGKSRVPTIAIIGVGFSGAAVAIHLVRLAPQKPLRVVLVNKSGCMGRGIAYETRNIGHLLNVPVGNMSALSDVPENFLHFCQQSDPCTDPASFVPRRIYGEYLEALLATVEHSRNATVALDREVGEVVSVRVDANGKHAHVLLTDGRAIVADRVVLAFGHSAPANLPVLTPSFYDSERYIRDPWEHGALRRIRDDDTVLLLGSGLTAVDVALSLQDGRTKAAIHCISRRGLSPVAHRTRHGTSHGASEHHILEGIGASVRAYVATLRREIDRCSLAGDDWHDVLDSLRPHIATLWHRLSLQERARFLRHVRPYWDVLRHRCSPEVSVRFAEMLKSNTVSIAAGHILAYREEAHDVVVTWRRRGTHKWTEQLRVSYVINCTGPDTDVLRCSSPLIEDLLKRGLMRKDSLGLGIDVDNGYALVDHKGQSSAFLYYVGPLLRARDWEATAVPELRAHANCIAQRLLESLNIAAAVAYA
ncbi:FAD-dependent oxidoreductase [Paraburkholderia sp. NMBU_R16]|nr:FAD-dependent oxidoreductase [Paraburkholderia sp. NMBU_R16]